MEEYIKKANVEAREFITKHPQYAPEVRDYLNLMISEIQDGESPQNEYDLFIQSLEQLLE